MSYYHINGVHLNLQPTRGRWMDRDIFGIGGTAHAIYSDYRQFEMTWDLMDVSELKQIQDYFNLYGSTGYVVVDLPTYNTATYSFTSYTGCVLQEPTFGEYFEEHPTSAKLLVVNIRT